MLSRGMVWHSDAARRDPSYRGSLAKLLPLAVLAAGRALASDPPPISTNSIPELSQSGVKKCRFMNRARLTAESVEETKGRAHPLRWDDRLAGGARRHAKEMASAGFLGHQGLEGSLASWMPNQGGNSMECHRGKMSRNFKQIKRAEAAFMDEPKFWQNHRGSIVRAPHRLLYTSRKNSQTRASVCYGKFRSVARMRIK
jgi:hypothetical protein